MFRQFQPREVLRKQTGGQCPRRAAAAKKLLVDQSWTPLLAIDRETKSRGSSRSVVPRGVLHDERNDTGGTATAGVRVVPPHRQSARHVEGLSRDGAMDTFRRSWSGHPLHDRLLRVCFPTGSVCWSYAAPSGNESTGSLSPKFVCQTSSAGPNPLSQLGPNPPEDNHKADRRRNPGRHRRWRVAAASCHRPLRHETLGKPLPKVRVSNVIGRA